jgi:hypothetical protein
MPSATESRDAVSFRTCRHCPCAEATAEERRHHQAQMDALHRAESQRVAAQVRKVLLSGMRTPMFGDSWWTVRIDNPTNAVTIILAVDVKAVDTNVIDIPTVVDGLTTP